MVRMAHISKSDANFKTKLNFIFKIYKEASLPLMKENCIFLTQPVEHLAKLADLHISRVRFDIVTTKTS